MSTISGVGPNEPTILNSKGAGQSDSPYRMDLVPMRAVLDVSRCLKLGASKYGENNWRNLELRDHVNHALVHLAAWLAGDTTDEHLNHAATRALFALETELQQKEDTKEDQVQTRCAKCACLFALGYVPYLGPDKLRYHKNCLPT